MRSLIMAKNDVSEIDYLLMIRLTNLTYLD
jgi:hypothetical protein